MGARKDIILAGALCAVLAAPAAALSSAERQANLDSFEQVWRTVRDKHWDPKLGGLDWQGVHDELRKKVEAATSTDEARGVMQDMLGRLKQTHFGIVPASVYRAMDGADSKSAPGEGSTGIDARVVDGRATVTLVDPGSPAAAAGVKPGWQIVRIDGGEVEPRLAAIRKQFADSTLLDLMQARVITGRLEGPAGKSVKVEFIDGAGKTTTLELRRGEPRGELAKIGNLPPMYFWEDHRTLSSRIGYVRFNLFADPDPLIDAFKQEVKACGGCVGFIIDLRGNPGGLGVLAMGVAGWFVDQSGQQLGTMYLRDAKLNFVIFPRPEPFRGPLAVLVDGCSASTSEIFAGGLKDLGRARIFGERTAGAALPSLFERLPNGDGFQYAVANYIAAGGKPLEGYGATPDEEVKLTRAALLEGRDPVVDAAVSWIQKQTKH